MTTHTATARTAFENYKKSVSDGTDTTIAITLAAMECSLPAELDLLQQLINADYLHCTYEQLRQEAAATVQELELSFE